MSFDKISRVLELETPIDYRKLKIKDFSKKVEVKKKYTPTSPISGSLNLKSLYSHSTTDIGYVDTINYTSSGLINYGSNIIRTNLQLDDLESFKLQSFTIERKIGKTLDLQLGDVNYVSLPQGNLSSQSSLWGVNLDFRNALTNKTKVASYSIDLQQRSLIKVIINKTAFSSFYLDAGTHILKDIPKFNGQNSLEIIAQHTTSGRLQEDILIQKTFFYDPKSVTQGWWDLDFQYGYPKNVMNLTNVPGSTSESTSRYNANNNHLGINFTYMYTHNLRVLHLLKYGLNYHVFGMQFNNSFRYGTIESSYGIANEYGKDNYLLQHSLLLNKPFKSPLFISSTINSTNKNFLLSKNFLFSEFFSTSLGYRLTGVDNALSVTTQFKHDIFDFSHELQYSMASLKHALSFRYLNKGWLLSFNIFSNDKVPFSFFYGVTKSFKNGLEFQKSNTATRIGMTKSNSSDFSHRLSLNIADNTDINADISYQDYRLGTRILSKQSVMLRDDYINFQNHNYLLRFSYKENYNNKSYIQKDSNVFLNTGLVFTGTKFAIYQGSLNSFALITAKNNLKGTQFYANKKEADMFGNIVIPLSGETTVVASAPEANPWMDLGDTTFELNPSEFSGYHLEIGGIGTHAIMIILQDKFQNSLINETVTIVPVKTIVPIKEMQHTIGYGGRLIALGLVLGSYELRFDNSDYAPLRFKIRETDENLVRFGIITANSVPKTIFTQTKDDLEKSRQKLLKKLYKTNSDNPPDDKDDPNNASDDATDEAADGVSDEVSDEVSDGAADEVSDEVSDEAADEVSDDNQTNLDSEKDTSKKKDIIKND